MSLKNKLWAFNKIGLFKINCGFLNKIGLFNKASVKSQNIYPTSLVVKQTLF